MRLLFIMFASLWLVLPCNLSAQSSGDTQDLGLLIEKIDNLFNDEMFAHAHWGVFIKSVETDSIWYAVNENKLFMPASNVKIPTAAVALLTLGPDFTFTTRVITDGTIEGGALHGDLLVWSDGDPTLYERFYDDSRDVFRQWAQELKEKGITTITGNIIGDDNAFQDYPYGWGWSYSLLDAWYAAEVGALQLNENYVDIRMKVPDSPTGKLVVKPNLVSSYYTIEDDLTVVPGGRNRIQVERDFGTNNITIGGTAVAGTGWLVRSPSIHNPTLFYTTVLKETLLEEGIQVAGEPVDIDDLEEWQPDSTNLVTLIEHHSPPLSEILKVLMKRSQNLYAETMTRTVGFHLRGEGSFEKGAEVVDSMLAVMGIESESYQYADGSGLSRYNYFSPQQFAAMLAWMNESPYSAEWYESLPVAGVDGTLEKRMRGTRAEKNAHAKTGTIANVRGLSGYVTTASGERVVFSFLVNAHLRTNRDTERITDTVLDLISNYEGAPVSP